MTSGKKPVSCLPCAKRKVRCDKLQPCCHCKRRKKDTCLYPEMSGISHQLLRESAERIERLEAYIRGLGGNPKMADEVSSQPSTAETPWQASPEVNTPIQDEAVTITPLNVGMSPGRRAHQAISKTSELLAQGDGVTCVETPMWYSWKGHDHPSSPQHANGKTPKAHYLPTILSRRQALDDSVLMPASKHILVLWSVFLKNVHPLVKIFFDWEVATVVERAQRHASPLAVEEEALINGIRLIATLTMSVEECKSSLSEVKDEVLLRCQRSLEHALERAEYTETTDKRVLQAFMLYILAMRDRTRPASIYPLMGIAGRVAERIGLHHDGTMFGLGVVRSEERRRIWWQLQFMDLSIARLVGTISLTIFANWDTKIPSNLEDDDFRLDLEAMPVESKGLTSISPCLWRYSILQMRREALRKNSSEAITWIVSPHVTLAEKDQKIDEIEKMLAEKFLQHCELLNPLHVYLQIGIRQFVLAARSNARQPTLVNARISELDPQTRQDLFEICSKSLEYFVMSQTTPSIAGFRWGSEMFFQVASFVYLVLEAHHRYDDSRVWDLWNLIGRVYDVHSDLMTATNRPEMDFIARITVAAWQKYEIFVRQQKSPTTRIETPEWIQKLCHNFNLRLTGSSGTDEAVEISLGADTACFLPEHFDFDMIDWSAWEALL